MELVKLGPCAGTADFDVESARGNLLVLAVDSEAPNAPRRKAGANQSAGVPDLGIDGSPAGERAAIDADARIASGIDRAAGESRAARALPIADRYEDAARPNGHGAGIGGARIRE